MARRKVKVLEGELCQLKSDLEENNSDFQNQLASVHEKMDGSQTQSGTSEAKETIGGQGRGGNPNPFRGGENQEVEILEGGDEMPPLELLSREEISIWVRVMMILYEFGVFSVVFQDDGGGDAVMVDSGDKGDPDVDHGFYYDEQGRVDILNSPFFDVSFGNDPTAKDYVERIIYQLTLAIEEQIPTGRWCLVSRRPTPPASTSSKSATNPGLPNAAVLTCLHDSKHRKNINMQAHQCSGARNKPGGWGWGRRDATSVQRGNQRFQC
ncbi:hypothetical protein M5K25_014298 [Dendrobium thyrsiflorum]|uniref:Uncharacterized protein n=1 Tax=Dendrobium thyrsiflorum TaxID=117978 RepID=A0ABD0V2F7_DENTH